MSFDNNKSTTKMMYAGKQQQRRTWATKTNNLDNRNLSFEEGCGEQEEEECFDLSHGAHNSNIGICRKQRHCTQRYSDLSGEEPPAVEPSKAESEAAVKAPKKRGRRKKVVATATNKTQSKRLSEAAPSSSVEETKLEPTTSNETTTETEVHKEPKKRGRSKKVTHIDTRLILSEKRQRTKHNNAFEFSGNNKSVFYGWTTEKRNEKRKKTQTSPAPEKRRRLKQKISDEDDIDNKPLLATVRGMSERAKHCRRERNRFDCLGYRC